MMDLRGDATGELVSVGVDGVDTIIGVDVA
jgi:hypothetical protein